MIRSPARSIPWVHSIAALTILVLALGVAARAVRYGLNFPFWGDEAFVAVDFLPRDGAPREFAALFKPLTYGQIVPLGYSWATLAVTRVFGLSEYALRALPFVAGIVALLLFWRFTRGLFNARVALLCAGFLAGAYYPIRHGAEVKPYATDLLVALVLLMLAWRAYRVPQRWDSWAALLLFAPLAVWCSYPSIFMLAAIGVLLLYLTWQRRCRMTILLTALFGVLVLGSFWLMYQTYGKPHAAAVPQLAGIDMWQQTFPPLREFWWLPVWLLEIHTGNMLAYPQGAKSGGSTLTAILVCVGAWRLWRKNRPLLWLLLGPLPFNFIAAALEKYPYGGTVRISMFMAPAFCTLAGYGLYTCIVWLARRNPRWLARMRGMRLNRRLFPAQRWDDGVRAAAFVLMAFSIASIVGDAIQPYKKGANEKARQMVRNLTGGMTADDRLIVFNSINPNIQYAPFIAPWKGDGAQLIFYLTRLSPTPVQWAPPVDTVAPLARGRTALLVYYGRNFEPFYDAGQFADYRAALESRLGPAKREEFILQKRRDRSGQEIIWQAIDVYRFE